MKLSKIIIVPYRTICDTWRWINENLLLYPVSCICLLNTEVKKNELFWRSIPLEE